MNSSAEKILYRKAALIFEELGFLMPRPESGGASQNGNISAVVAFKGPFSGYLQVSLDKDILSQLSSNMLGDEELSTDVLQQDSLREIANVICGNALPAIYGFESIFHLDAPAIHENKATIENAKRYTQVTQIHLSFNLGNAEITLYVEPGAQGSVYQQQ
jgi:CheY-specific phosphatase CheX